MLLGIIVIAALVSTAVIVHFEFLRYLSGIIRLIHLPYHWRIVVGVFGALLAHTVEVGLFALGYYFMQGRQNFGTLEGNFDGSFADSYYFSFTCFSTLGFGDIEPLGPIRFLTGIESLTGLVLITWSASFLYYEMQRYWEEP